MAQWCRCWFWYRLRSCFWLWYRLWVRYYFWFWLWFRYSLWLWHRLWIRYYLWLWYRLWVRYYFWFWRRIWEWSWLRCWLWLIHLTVVVCHIIRHWFNRWNREVIKEWWITTCFITWCITTDNIWSIITNWVNISWELRGSSKSITCCFVEPTTQTYITTSWIWIS